MAGCPFKSYLAPQKVLGLNAEIAVLAVMYLCCRKAEDLIIFSSFLCVEVVTSIKALLMTHLKGFVC